MSYTIRWKGTPRPDLEPRLREDMRGIEDDLDGRMGDLITHTCFLSRNRLEGPCIHAYGEEGNPHEVIAEYIENPKWVSINEVNDG